MMSVIEDTSYVTETDAALQNVRGASTAKGKAVGHQKNGFADTRDSVSISASARSKHAAAVTGEDGEAAATATTGTVYKNETHALKAALRQLSDESGTPLGGWGLGHYRKAFRESEGGDLTAVREIFNAKYGIRPAPVAEDPAVPADSVIPVDPVIPVPDPTEGEDPSPGDMTGDAGDSGDELAGIVDGDDSEKGGLAVSDGTDETAEDANLVAGIELADVADPAAELLETL
ncbi:hypothetical protein KL86DPRO_11833 [uncultured delta proteobacterium]|uniref:Uncharacterized protein n=1 Tax=uncultured delta proteobacterium TaxID=34034 RepID=A0A212JMR2_9DELT|nr:hypothetical protein KL86DPRO_11833 [uncultured delta proteobacterium]